MSRQKRSLTDISDLIPDKHNANRGTERGRALLESSLQKYGAGRSILIDKNGAIIAGNKTAEEASQLGLTKLRIIQTRGDEIVAVQRMDLDLAKDKKARELATVDNRAGELNLDWDPAALVSMQDLGIDLTQMGFNEKEIVLFLADQGNDAEAPEPQIDRAEELREKWKTERGQVWEIPSNSLVSTASRRASHRILCGDSTRAADVEAVMAGRRAQMAFTDPPWNAAIGKDSNPRHRQREGLENDDLPADQFRTFLEGFAALMVPAVQGDVYVVMACGEWPTIDGILRTAGLHWSGTIIWGKDSFVLGRSNYHRRFEPIWYGWNRKGKSSYCAGRDQDDLWEIPRPKASEEHPTMKPVALPQRAIANSSVRGSIVYEPFLGAGSTMCAAELAGRICYSIEIEPKYVAVTLERLKDMGLCPKLVSSTKTQRSVSYTGSRSHNTLKKNTAANGKPATEKVVEAQEVS